MHASSGFSCPQQDFRQKTYNIALIQPDNYPHSAALAELAETLMYAFNALGLTFQFNINGFDPSATNIVLGAHLLGEDDFKHLPAGVILYNSEQIDDKSTWITAAYIEALKNSEVWDYNQENVQQLVKRGVTNVKYVPIGYVPELTRIPVFGQAEQDIDVLFYGQINERRKNILEALIAKGLRVEFLTDVYRGERDKYISRAKLVLNMHYYEAAIFESVRVSYLLANEKAVVAESNATTSAEASLEGAVCAVPYEQLVKACVLLIQEDKKRNELAKQGFSIFSSIDEREILARALGGAVTASAAVKLPNVFHIGSGRMWNKDYFNVDIQESVRPDIICDISAPDLFEKTFTSLRFGDVVFRKNMFDVMLANHVLEHISDLKTAMTNCLALLKPGGIFQIGVPYDLSLGGWQDPTHVRGFNENSWAYYATHSYYLGWTEARFDVLSVTVALSDLGKELKAKGMSQNEIMRTPRAVDAMVAMLRKRYLLESEIINAEQQLTRPWDEAEETKAS